jgi:predicted GIY-YIG superfamily endonuclease
MTDALRDLPVLALDAQASGASPTYGDLLELGWTLCVADGSVGPVRSHWIVPRTRRPVPRAVRELTGWNEACVVDAVEERAVWDALRGDLDLAGYAARVPTVIHFARFELPFLRDLHQRLAESGDFPFDAICVHAIAERLFPDLPRRSIRALAGYLGHSPELVRRAAGHVEATAFIWTALLPSLEEKGIATWSDLKTWLAEPPVRVRRTKRSFPLPAERRRALPDAPGVYRFVRKSGDVLYVGKATSLKKRVAGHFKSRGPATERGLELLTQVHEIVHTETATLLEAALLETDEIKRIDPPYNVQLRTLERRAWFASRDLSEAVPEPDAAHPVGPLPSERAVSSLNALAALLEGDSSKRVRCVALAVPSAFGPDDATFVEGWEIFVAATLNRLENSAPSAARRVARAARALWLERGRAEPEAATETAPDVWDVARVVRRLERHLVHGGLLLRRARFLCLLADAAVAFREPEADTTRGLVVRGGDIVSRCDLEDVGAIAGLGTARPRPLRERQQAFDAATYDRLRVVATELRRIHDDGGELALRVGEHVFAGARMARLVKWI